MSLETEWKYRGRSESEVTTEPASAPTGLDAQKSEGFQRFYKAVVSPTHVRVTAGGRIVPNTRNTSSPTTKRLKGKPSSGVLGSTGQPAHAQAVDMQGNKAPAPPMYAVPPPYYPGYHPNLAHLNGPMPMMPMAMGMPMPGAVPMPATASVAGEVPADSNSPQKENRTANEEDHATPSPDESNKPETNIKISAPEQFDRTKPYLYNGHPVYPVPFPPPYGMPFMAPAYVGAPGYAYSPFPGAMMGSPFPVNPMIPSMSMPAPPPVSGPSHTSATNPTAPAGGNVPLQPPSAPPISSIRPSHISQKQIESLRNALKYHEDKVKYNRHQIDEEQMNRTIVMLKEQIQRFEDLRQSQLENEKKLYPQPAASEEATTPTARSGPSGVKQHIADGTTTQSASKTGSQTGSLRSKDRSRPKAGRVGGQTGDIAFGLEAAQPFAQMANASRKITLPTAAVLAPPFQPRSASGFVGSAIDNILSNSDHRQVPEDLGGTTAQPLFPTGCNSRAITSGAMLHGYQALYPDLGRPYLVGTLPLGVNPHTARDADYVYERELTNDEIEARFLYWGKVSRASKPGLPRYDGRNFYPASPLKDAIHGQNPRSSGVRYMTTGVIAPEYAQNIPATKPNDPFRPSTPVNGTQEGKRVASKENDQPVSGFMIGPALFFLHRMGLTASRSSIMTAKMWERDARPVQL